jgi:enamine deaminase RidA (YjgF/YER057c/UK114 family)
MLIRMSPEARLAELGIELPPSPSALGNYLRAKRHGDLVFLSGAGPIDPATGAAIRGKVGADLDVAQAYDAARLTGLHLLAALSAELGSLDAVESIVRVFGMVNGAPGFTEQPAVVDGCSDFLVEVFGDAGRHARAAVGVAELPLGIAVEIELVAAAR